LNNLRAIAPLAVGIAATRRECRGEFKNLLPLREVRVEASETVVRRGEVRTDARLFARSVATSIAPA
jgi:hypothetical protein